MKNHRRNMIAALYRLEKKIGRDLTVYEIRKITDQYLMCEKNDIKTLSWNPKFIAKKIIKAI